MQATILPKMSLFEHINSSCIKGSSFITLFRLTWKICCFLGQKKPNCLMSQKLQRVNGVSLNTMDGSRPYNQIPKIPLVNPHGFFYRIGGCSWALTVHISQPNTWNMSGLEMNYLHSWDLTVATDDWVKSQATIVLCLCLLVSLFLQMI